MVHGEIDTWQKGFEKIERSTMIRKVEYKFAGLCTPYQILACCW